MAKVIITEEQIKNILESVLEEQNSKITSKDINKIDFKIDEFVSSLNETIREFKQLKDAIPMGLVKPTNQKINLISLNLNLIYGNVIDLKSKLLEMKKQLYKKPEQPEIKGS